MKHFFRKIMLSLCLITSVSVFAEDSVVLINPFKVPAGKLAESVSYWEKARDFLQKQPGYISTRLHQSLQKDATYQLINVAEWESVAKFKVATLKMRKYFRAHKVKRIEGLGGSPALYQVIRK